MNKTKVCKKCGVEKDINEFYKKKSNKDGYMGKCKECEKEYKKQYYKENKEEIVKNIKQYQQENKEEISKYKKQYREENKEEISKYNKQYYKENKEYYQEYNKQYYKENKEEISKKKKQYQQENKEEIAKYKKQYYKQYYKENKEEISKYNKQYHKENPHVSFNASNRRRSKEEQQGKGINGQQWFEMMKFFDFKCAYSNEKLKSTIDTYGRTIDHIVALENGGLNEPWNCIPMRKGYNSSKKDKINSLDWYLKQDFYSEDRLNKIIEWQIYAYNKWATEDDEDLILIVDII